jgi:hypothetical protein
VVSNIRRRNMASFTGFLQADGYAGYVAAEFMCAK